MSTDRVTNFIRGELNLSEESCSHVDQGVSWPFVEPIHGCTVDDSWEHSCPESEGIANWGEAETKMEIFPNLVEEEIEELIWSIQVTCTFGFSSHFSEQAVELVLGEELWDIT